MKRLVIGGAVLIVAFVTVVWFSNRDSSPSDSTMQITASFFPLAHFAEQVGGEAIRIATITPAGAEPHDYEPSPRQITEMYESTLVLMNGSGLDPWAEALRPDLETRGVRVVAMSDHVALRPGAEEEFVIDPHLWLDPVLAQKQVELIRDQLIQFDAAHRLVYEQRADAYLGKLRKLDEQYRDGLAQCQLRDVVTSHAAFGYLAARYNLTQIPISGISPEEEPSPARLAEIARLVKEKKIKYIFFETLLSPKLAETIAQETGAQTLMLNPIEGLSSEEVAQGKTYLSVMEDNLQHLRLALQCT